MNAMNTQQVASLSLPWRANLSVCWLAGVCGFVCTLQVPDESHLTPAAVLAASLPTLRACGLSERKASYLLDLAAHFEDGRLSDELLTSE